MEPPHPARLGLELAQSDLQFMDLASQRVAVEAAGFGCAALVAAVLGQ
jgi:hypothetical protein